MVERGIAVMHDIHIHTSLSSCADPGAELSDYAPAIKEANLSAVGFANHLWDSAIPGASDWYKPQNIEHVLRLKEELKNYDFGSTKVYFGCETEYIGNGVVGMHPDNAGLFDYILAPPNHFHMAGFTRPENLTALSGVRQIMIERFLEICDIDFAFGLVHPFVPLGYEAKGEELLHGFRDEDFERCFKYAAKKNKYIEINLGIFRYMDKYQLTEYKRLMTIARICGCKFFLGSDSHCVSVFRQNTSRLLNDFITDCGIVLPDNPFEN